MNITVTFRHMDSSEALRKYAEEKTERLAKYLVEPIEVHWVLSVEKIRQIADITVTANGVTLKGQGDTSDLYAAIDMGIDKVENQVRKHKEKVKDHHNSSIRYGAAPAEAAPGIRPRIVKKENVFLKPMSVEEAALQMDIAKTDFLVFTDSNTSNINVIYRLQDGDYGLIETSK
ncbi:MAG: ribosome-associated translation inhibitor RaiA [Deltaproteobacteria bacterium]|nr:ribosome-associated translation inhibitor RaiA [Deltaproteobacteria bacterium]